MQIGEFARICKTRISVLRHYDKEGLLSPDYVDNFTGYRYYSKEQIPVFMRITALKKAGFSLIEIKQIISSCGDTEQILALFENKKSELRRTLCDLEDAARLVIGADKLVDISFYEKNNCLYAESGSFDSSRQNEMRESMEKAILTGGFQRISLYMISSEQDSSTIHLTCQVIKLSDSLVNVSDTEEVIFEDDPVLVGKWETVGEYAVKEDFYGNVCRSEYSSKEIYFLPHGKPYWCYSWSKGKLVCNFGYSRFVNDFTTEEFNGVRYMFISFKSYEYRRGGKPTVLVLRQVDNKEYTLESVAKKDDINKPFVNDKRVLGKWNAFGYCKYIETFAPFNSANSTLMYSALEFCPDGELINYFRKTIINSRDFNEWTKGYVLNKDDITACKYEIRKIEGKEYLFLEWKNGDYVYGGLDPLYYVFCREES